MHPLRYFFYMLLPPPSSKLNQVFQEMKYILRPCTGGTAMKASVQQAAKVREHNWTPGGACMPLRLAMPPSTARPTTRPVLHGSALMTSVVKRGRDLLAPSPITEEDEGSWAGVAGPRRLSYSSERYCHCIVQCW